MKTILIKNRIFGKYNGMKLSQLQSAQA